ncbi:MAG: DegT/DnrJ/EryC1/StrS family aminotransferase [Bacteroidales bacterium]|nr:DegT/DnrJ/EryC1/StrS family aminotransferase [Bacteroidales bacterium]
MIKVGMNNLSIAYQAHEKELNKSLFNCIKSGQYIMGEEVQLFTQSLQDYTQSPYVIPCANGTDALQLAMMALPLHPGDEVLIPAFNYIAAAEAACLLKLIPRFVDVDESDFNSHAKHFKAAITPKTKALVAVHLFGQCCDMEEILQLAKTYNLFVIEDNAQSLGCRYKTANGLEKISGTIGDIGILSFFPTKNLGAMGDGGALLTSDASLANRLRMLASHGQQTRYRHEIIGMNSRLDTLQAAILNIKIGYLNEELEIRRFLAQRYIKAFSEIKELRLPIERSNTWHTYNQFTIIVQNDKRDILQNYLRDAGIATMIYYPESLDRQPAFADYKLTRNNRLETSHILPSKVLSLPLYPYLKIKEQDYVIEKILDFYN